MDKQDSLDFQLAKYEEEHVEEIEQMWKDSHKFARRVFLAIVVTMVFLVLIV